MNTISQHGGSPRWRFVRHGGFWLAMAAAPLSWAVLLWVFHLPLRFAASMSLWALLSAIVLYPVLEEMVFRGLLMDWLRRFAPMRRSTAGVSLANVTSSLLFTGLHFFNHAPLWAALVFFPSLIFGWSRERFDSILPAIVLHVFYNAGFLLLFA